MDIRDYLEELRRKPEHIRRRIALGTSFGITSLVFIGWLTALTSSGTLAATPLPREENAPQLTEAVQQTGSSIGQLLGAVQAARPVEGSVDGLQIVDANVSSTLKEDAPLEDERTVIPF